MTSTSRATVHDLPFPQRTTLANALLAYGELDRRPGDADATWYSRVGLPIPWYERYLRNDHKATELQRLIQEQAADAANEAKISINLNEFRRELEAALPSYSKRRQVEHQVAMRLKQVALDPATPARVAKDMTDLAESMFYCRCEGHAGVTQGKQDRRFSWCHKCGSTRLCPDDAREHSAYEAERFLEKLLEHVAAGGRAHYLVFTRPSAPIGQMKQAVDELWERFTAWREHKRPCKDKHRKAYGWSKRKKKILLWQPADAWRTVKKNDREVEIYDGPGIHGVLAQLECHLTAKGMWHPHLNVIVLTRGRFDYRLARKLWGWNMSCEPIPRKKPGEGYRRPTAEDFARAFKELIKYAARHVGEKNAEKAEAGKTDAPPLTDWPNAALAEWFAATREEIDLEGGETKIMGARWLRSYGLLHGLPPPELPEDKVDWLTRVTFTDDGIYAVAPFVGSITGSKYFGSSLSLTAQPYRVPKIRPPPEPRR